MYVAEYDVEGARWQQAAVELRYPRGAEEEDTEKWWGRLRVLVRALDGVPQASAALRVQLAQRLQAAVFAVAPAHLGHLLRQAVGSFTQLDTLADGEVRYPREAAEHDLLLRFPRFTCRAALPVLTNGGAWFSFDFRVNPLLNDLMLEARGLGHPLAYHLNVEPFAAGEDWQRQAARNALRVAEVPGVPPRLEKLQRALSARLRDATHLCEEFVGVETPAGREWLQGALQGRFSEAYGRHVEPRFDFEDDGHQGPLTATRHTAFFETLHVGEVCGAAIDAEERARLLSWRPLPELRDRREERAPAPEPAGAAPALDYSGMPSPYPGKEPYVFISYKREDLGRIKPLVAEVSRAGHRVWFDKGIPGGAEWDALIEERVQSCELLVLFLSQAAVGSKYVRREVKFADTLRKPIVGIRLERDIDLAHGMAMLMNQYQVIDGSAPGVGEELDRAVRFVRLL